MCNVLTRPSLVYRGLPPSIVLGTCDPRSFAVSGPGFLIGCGPAILRSMRNMYCQLQVHPMSRGQYGPSSTQIVHEGVGRGGGGNFAIAGAARRDTESQSVSRIGTSRRLQAALSSTDQATGPSRFLLPDGVHPLDVYMVAASPSPRPFSPSIHQALLSSAACHPI